MSFAQQHPVLLISAAILICMVLGLSQPRPR